MTPVTECIRMSNHSFQPLHVQCSQFWGFNTKSTKILPCGAPPWMKSYQRGWGGVCGLMWAYSGGPWHERVGEPPAATSCKSEYREEKWMGETNGEYFSEHRWQSALREMAQGDERGWGRWERRVVAFQRWRGVWESGGYGNSASSPLTHLPGLATLLAWVSSHRGNSDITAGTGGAGLALLAHLARFSRETDNLAPHQTAFLHLVGENSRERGKKNRTKSSRNKKKKKKRFCSTKKKKKKSEWNPADIISLCPSVICHESNSHEC